MRQVKPYLVEIRDTQIIRESRRVWVCSCNNECWLADYGYHVGARQESATSLFLAGYKRVWSASEIFLCYFLPSCLIRMLKLKYWWQIFFSSMVYISCIQASEEQQCNPCTWQQLSSWIPSWLEIHPSMVYISCIQASEEQQCNPCTSCAEAWQHPV